MAEITMFSEEEKKLLRRIAKRIIPPKSEEGLPGADDEKIFTQLIVYLSTNADKLRRDMNDLLAMDGGVSVVCALGTDDFEVWVARWAEGWPKQTHAFFKTLVPMTLHAYYQDSRVQEAYGRRPGPPFPEGYVVVEGDWSLLNHVREREPLFRQ